MIDDEVDQELQIMAERASDALDPETFRRPIAELCRRPITTVKETDSVADTVHMMQKKEIGAVAVMAGEKLTGIFTERDVFRRALGQLGHLQDHPVSEIMTPNPTYLLKTDSIVFLMNKMHVGGYRHVPILDGTGRPLHMISVRDLLHFFFEHFPPELVNVPSDPYRGPARQYSG